MPNKIKAFFKKKILGKSMKPTNDKQTNDTQKVVEQPSGSLHDNDNLDSQTDVTTHGYSQNVGMPTLSEVQRISTADKLYNQRLHHLSPRRHKSSPHIGGDIPDGDVRIIE